MFYQINITELKRVGGALALSLLLFCFSCYAQISPTVSDNELTRMKITVTRESGGEPGSLTEKEIRTLPIQEVPMLEAGDLLTIRFCEKCPGRSFSDLGYTRLLVFFVNPASAAKDLENDAAIDLATGKASAADKTVSSSARAIAEIKFEGDLKSKKNLQKIYGEHRFVVPYRSIPLIFLVSRGDYKDDLRRIILEKQADVLKLSEQATVLSQLPEAVSFLLEVKTALQTPAAYNPDFLQSFVQRAQYFRFNQTNCFQQTYLYRTDEARLGCLVKNVNPDQLTADLQDFNLTRLARTGAAEGVAQLRLRYQGLSIFFDAAGAAIEIIGRLFKKKPLNIQLATLQMIQPASGAQSAVQSVAQSGSQSASQLVKKPSGETDYLSLRQFATNAPSNAEKALIIAPLKWKETEEIIRTKDLQAVEALPACRCLHPGKNIFWLDTEHLLVKQEIKTVSFVLEKKSDESLKLASFDLPVSPADGSLTLALDESLWRKIKDWRTAILKIKLRSGFEKVEREIELNVPQTPNWQILRSWNDPVRKGEKITLKLFPNTARRECLDKIVLTDERGQKIQLSSFGEYKQDPGNHISLHLSARLLDKLQAGKIIIEIYENGEKMAPTGKMFFMLVNK